MITRLEHWLHVLPPVEGADVRLINPSQTKELYTGVDAPSTSSQPSRVDDGLQRSDCTDVEPDACRPVAVSETTAPQHPPEDDSSETPPLPDFPLLPVSRGFKMKLQKLLVQFESTLTEAGIITSRSCSPS